MLPSLSRFWLLFLPLAFGLGSGAAAGINLRMEASTTWAENLSRSAVSSDWRDALLFDTRVSASLLQQWTAGLVTTTRLDAALEQVPRYSLNNAVSGGLGLTARQKFGWGPFAPALSLDVGLRGREARLDGDDGWTTSAALQAARRLTTSWRLALNGDWQHHSARHPIWDTRQHRLYASLTWDITDRLQLSHSNGRLWGEFTANASPTIWGRARSGALGALIRDYYRTVPQGVSPAFGPDWVAYRVEGRVSFWWLELSPALGRNTSLPLRYESRLAVNLAGVKYRQDIWSLQWLHRF